MGSVLLGRFLSQHGSLSPNFLTHRICCCGTGMTTTSHQPRTSKRRLGQCPYPLITKAQEVLVSGYEWSGLPWWLMIGAGAIAVRTCCAPVVVWHEKEIAKFNAEEVKEKLWAVEGKENLEANEEVPGNMNMMAVVAPTVARANIMFGLSAVASLTLWNIAGYDPSVGAIQWDSACGIGSESLLWMDSMAVPDRLLILPLLLFVTNSLNIAVLLAGSQRENKTELWRIGNAAAFVMSAIATQLPAIISLYWLSSSATALLLNSWLKRPSIRRLLRMPATPSDLDTPVFKHLILSFVKRQQQRPW